MTLSHSPWHVKHKGNVEEPGHSLQREGHGAPCVVVLAIISRLLPNRSPVAWGNQENALGT